MSVGLGLVGCGGDSASAAFDPTTDDSAPRNPDAPPSGADDSPPNSDDPAPGNADHPQSPGGSSDGGGNAESLCRELCDILDVTECAQGEPVPAARAFCETECVIPQEQLACATVYAAAISCLLGPDSLCVSDDEPGNPFEECGDEFDAADSCEEQYEPPDPDPVEGCTLAGGCSCGDDLCAQCECAAGAQAATLCATVCDQ
ncbi:MAG TPA: hypothetical protein VEX18_21710 [Polyangiaceae bacterium]|nr:hypothetical protein [Polyangiaceae bacterium]